MKIEIYILGSGVKYFKFYKFQTKLKYIYTYTYRPLRVCFSFIDGRMRQTEQNLYFTFNHSMSYDLGDSD